MQETIIEKENSKESGYCTKENKNTKITPHFHGHRQRLKNKFANHPTSLANYELIEMLLFYVYPRQDTKLMAKQLLAQHDHSLFQLFNNYSMNSLAVNKAIQTFANLQQQLVKFPKPLATIHCNNTAMVLSFSWHKLHKISHPTFLVVLLNSNYDILISNSYSQLPTSTSITEWAIEQQATYFSVIAYLPHNISLIPNTAMYSAYYQYQSIVNHLQISLLLFYLLNHQGEFVNLAKCQQNKQNMVS